MAKTKISEYDSTAANNTDIDSINIAEGMAPSNVNNAIRELMAHLKDGLGAGTPVFLDQTNNAVGIGTSSPVSDAKLTLSDTTSPHIFFQRTSGGAGDSAIGMPSSAALAFYTPSDQSSVSGLSEAMRIDSSGLVGIGTSNPFTTLEVESAGASLAGLTSHIEISHNSLAANTGGALVLSSNNNRHGGIKGGSDSGGGTGYLSFHTRPSSGDLDEAMRIDSSGNVGIGFNNPDAYVTDANSLVIKGQFRAQGVTNTAAAPVIGVRDDNTGFYLPATNTLGITTDSTERMRIDSSGNVLIGKTSTSSNVAGSRFGASGNLELTRSGGQPLYINRQTSDGTIVTFAKDGTTVGSIQSRAGAVATIILDPRTPSSSQGCGLGATSGAVVPANSSGLSDDLHDFGAASQRWDDIFATNGTIQTSDEREKQQIASLTDAEITAAKAISKLFKTFKWNDKVEAKGDAARTHTGVIAQQVEQAMTDAGLTASNYAFWCSDTWWETQTEVAAVEADEENDIEAQDAYTRTDTYNTLEEAPEGATERNRKGIRYPELLSFIGAATEQRLTSIEARLDALEG